MSKPLREEAASLLPVLNAAIEAPEASLNSFKALWMRNALALGIGGRSQAEWASLFEVYGRTLGGYSLEALEAAFHSWNNAELYPNEPMRHAFFPKPAELKTLAEKFMTDLRMKAYRARRALAFVEDKGLEWTAERKKAEREKMIALGYLTPDGKVNFNVAARTMDHSDRLAPTPHQAAQQIREMAARADEVGDVV